MSSEAYYIVDNPRPISLDFTSLKSEGLAYIREYMDNDWTNLNSSDPGVTILDQLCYALTELGYCNDFPMKDILTGVDGKLQIDDQFYLPENILTTAPITINDFRKYIADGVDGIDNLIILPVSDDDTGISGIYQVLVLINSTITEPSRIDDVCKAAFFCANKARGLGEIFLMPVCLIKSKWFLQGKITISTESSVDSVLSAIQQAINDFIFPKIIAEGYDRLAEKNIPTDEIFNGPLLSKGWIPDNSLGTKRDKIRNTDITQVITAVPGVLSVSNILFLPNDKKNSPKLISCTQSEILFIDILGSLKPAKNIEEEGGILAIYCSNKQMSPDLLPVSVSPKDTEPQSNILYGASVNTQTVLPTGKFRDIDSYYSIQNTFPEIFRVGEDALISNASDFQIAQSRQLKGYLTLFDQVLANQFSQLSAIGQLFSFKNATTGTPLENHSYYALRDAFEIAHPNYPVPFRDFSPTYFYQSLYTVPNIRPLLKNSDAFKFGLEPNEADAVLVNDSWLDYQRDPYNSYISGLMDFMEDEKINLKRRDDILNHLLARHGESPLMIDAFINGSSYTGETMKDKVIFKSLYLQNIGLLSYYRQKGHNFIGAQRISAVMTDVTRHFEERILGWDSKDFIVDSEKIDKVEKLTQQHFINYAAIELKLCLLLGLKVLYKNFIAYYFSNIDLNTDGNNDKVNETGYADIKTAMWMMENRRGFIFLESSLLNYYTKKAGQSTPTTFAPNELIFIFPSFIGPLRSAEFLSRLDLFLQNEAPVRFTYQYYFADTNQLQKIIPAFTDWHNCLVYNDPDHIFNPWLIKSAVTLTEQLNELSIIKNE